LFLKFLVFLQKVLTKRNNESSIFALVRLSMQYKLSGEIAIVKLNNFLTIRQVNSLLVARGLSRAIAARITRKAVLQGVLDQVDFVKNEERKHPILFEGQVLAWIESGSSGAAAWRQQQQQKS
jgi:hypothetical protein